MSIHAPYNFVPLSRFIYLPHWADQVSHDVPFSDGISGTLNIELTCHTPTLVGGKQTKGTKEKAGKVEFCKAPNGELIIPPSSIKGMLTNVLEIASFARFNRLDDKRYSVRDLKAGFYMDRLKGNVKTGWLKFTGEKWEITPCKMVRIHQKNIVKHFQIEPDNWKKNDNKTAHKRYGLLQGLREIHFSTQANNDYGLEAIPSSEGVKGWVVVTGQPAGTNYNQPKTKKYDFVFYESSDTSKEVDQSVVNDFLFIHSESKDWDYWKEKKTAFSSTGIPVFFSESGGSISAYGLASLYKLAYRNSLHQAVVHTNPRHIEGNEFDLPELIMGRIRQSDNSSLRGRVNFSPARATKVVEYQEKITATVLSTPKPTYYPSYLLQPNVNKKGELTTSKGYVTLMDDKICELRGWKRYPTRSKHDILPAPDVGTEKENRKVQVKLYPVEAGTKFSFKVHVHNLKEAELGALLWAIDFGERANHYHSLGMGKPYGLGRVTLKILDEGTCLFPNTETIYEGMDLMDKARSSFTKLMTDAYSFATEEHTWINSPQLKELLAMTSTKGTGRKLSYMTTTDHFVEGKSEKKTLPLHSGNELTISDIKKESATVNEIKLLSDDDFLPLLEEIQDIREEAKRQAVWEKEASPLDLFIKELQDNVTDFVEAPSQKSPKIVHSLLQRFKQDDLINDISTTQTQTCLSIANLLVPLAKEKRIDKRILNRFINPLSQKDDEANKDA